MLCSCDERSQFAYITFGDNQGAERAMLLTVLVLPLVINLCYKLLTIMLIQIRFNC